jgi:hypothetical protein
MKIRADFEDTAVFVNVSVADVRVEHEVKLTDCTKWLNRTGVPRAR